MSHLIKEFDAADYQIPAPVLARTLSPALVIFLDQVRHNLGVMLQLCGGDPDRWRPHVKTAKVPLVYRELVDAGIRNFKCATTREATCILRVLNEAGVRGGDLLVAYPHREPALGRIADLAARHPETRVSVLCESPDDVAAVPQQLEIYVDINPQMNRTGVPMENLGVIRAIADQAAERFGGLHFYDGHVRDIDPAARRQKTEPLYGALLETTSALQDAGIEVDEIITSGTPSFPIALAYSPFQELESTRHRISPGTVVYHDTFSAEVLPDIDLRPAALVLSRVISHPADGLVTCDAGSKSIAAEAGHPCCQVIGHPGLVAQKPSEEHIPLAVEGGEAPPRGAPLLLFPKHVCPTVNLAEQALVIAAGRDPQIAEVSARAHDLQV